MTDLPPPLPSPASAAARPAAGWRPTERNLRWASGLVLLAYVALHLVDHALGLASLAVAETALAAVHRFWHGAVGSLLLYGAAALHLVLAFVGLWQRRSLRLPAVEAVRILLGFLLPLLLAGHLASMRWAYEAFGTDPTYTRVVRALWSPQAAAFQFAMMSAAWAHGCLGVHLALRARAVWSRLLPCFLSAVVLLPVLAALGFLSMGREIAASGATAPMLSAAQARSVNAAAQLAMACYGALALLLLAARAARNRVQAASGAIALRYPERLVTVPRGWSVLEASRGHGIAHLSVCGGRARCSTCRVRVVGPAAALPPPQTDELRTLERVRAPADVRLACQLRPLGDIAVTPLFAPGEREATGRVGREHDVAVLFVDLRRWSGLAERQWPFDLVYTLDRYFEIVGGAVRDSGGVANQFIGDSVMALFGLETDLPTGCRQAVAAATLVARRMDAWSASFEAEFGQPLDFGMGLHAGRAVVAEVGWQERTTVTAVGEVVNTASRLQDHSKTSASRLVVSAFVAAQAGLPDSAGVAETITVRGRGAPLAVLHVATL